MASSRLGAIILDMCIHFLNLHIRLLFDVSPSRWDYLFSFTLCLFSIRRTETITGLVNSTLFSYVTTRSVIFLRRRYTYWLVHHLMGFSKTRNRTWQCFGRSSRWWSYLVRNERLATEPRTIFFRSMNRSQKAPDLTSRPSLTIGPLLRFSLIGKYFLI